jgi:hypothetical protein
MFFKMFFLFVYCGFQDRFIRLYYKTKAREDSSQNKSWELKNKAGNQEIMERKQAVNKFQGWSVMFLF